MSSVQCLKQFVSERLNCAAEEIFRVFEQTVFEYEREIRRQRGLLESVRRPELHLLRTELPHHHHHVLKEQLCPQERDLSVGPEDQGPPHIKEEQEEEQEQQEAELHTAQEEEPLGPNKAPSPEIDACKREPSGYRALLSGDVPGSQSHAPRGASAEGEESQRTRHGDAVDNFPHRQSLFSNHAVRKSFTCAICGKGFRFKCRLNLHMRTHTGEKLYSCETCGKRFTQKTNVERHQRIHTGENPFVCKICGKGFKQVAERNVHARVHTDERLYCCATCGKRLKTKQTMLVHMRTHTGERPFICHTCGRSFIQATTLQQHMRNQAH